MTETWLLDLGSSRLKWQLRSEVGAVLGQGQHGWDARALYEWLPATRPATIWLTRVGAGEREQAVLAMIRNRHGDVPVERVQPRMNGPAGLHLHYDLRQFGADRYCALLGVLSQSSAPAVVIDAGTAVTVDVLAAGGEHLGGYILPGLRPGLEAVTRLFTPELRDQVVTALPKRPVAPLTGGGPAHDTAGALVQGWMQGLAGAVERLCSQSALRMGGGPVEWWLTGGDAPWLARLLSRPVRLEPGLVFDGLWLCARHARGRAGVA